MHIRRIAPIVLHRANLVLSYCFAAVLRIWFSFAGIRIQSVRHTAQHSRIAAVDKPSAILATSCIIVPSAPPQYVCHSESHGSWPRLEPICRPVGMC
ncbi:hypothetical protein K461DRAFT_277443 [Myriangium duriaei CBS 260.36]|uniref:Uncharacterized protein n=1 Tax=Myriangium duriaei CBS 260.36 TaxID=1168546 RepID=A0A9P4MH36_9PEZI|nr:hypothetical protein K461DRAFT_277443 [Myriangium duriaei CBS 260.36]